MTLVLILVASLIIADVAAGELKEVQASEILIKFEKGEPINYSYVKINGNINLAEPNMSIKARSIPPITITDSVISGYINVDNIILNSSIDFKRTTFMQTANFFGVRFEGPVDFDYSKFERDANFWGCEFNGPSNFAYIKFDNYTNFLGCTFIDESHFHNSRFNRTANFDGVVFRNISFFQMALFVGSASFLEAKFKEVEFAGSRFEGDVDFSSAQFTYPANFIGTTFGKRLIFNNVKFEKLLINWNNVKDKLVCDGSTYFLLIRNFKEMEQFETADDCYYQYRDLKRQGEPLGRGNILDYIAWLSCGYGVRWLNTILTALAILILFAFYYESWNIMGILHDFIIRKNIKAEKNQLYQKLKNSIYFSIVMLLSLPSEWFPAGKEEFALLLRLHMFSAVLERLIGWGLMLLLIGTLSRLMIRY